MEILKALILAIIEGATEFLPVSSTGHLILAEQFMQLPGEGNHFRNTFMIVIQLPAVLAVVVYFWRQLWPFGKDKDSRQILLLWAKCVVAFLPAAVLGVLVNSMIQELLFKPLPVALALFIGGIALIVIEKRPREATIECIEDLPWSTAFWVGCFQCIAMIPGVSRSAATIIGGMLLGARRKVAAEFSFFLAIPTMLGATTYSLWESMMNEASPTWTGEQWMLLSVGCVTSFTVALCVVAAFMTFIRKHTFIPFGYYRIVLGIAVLGLLLLG